MCTQTLSKIRGIPTTHKNSALKNQEIPTRMPQIPLLALWENYEATKE